MTPQAVTVSVPPWINSAAAARPNDSTAWAGLAVAGGQINLVVDEKVTIVRLGGGSVNRPSC